MFEYAGCYEKLIFYDDWQKVSFSPGRPKAGEPVAITAKVRNAGALDVKGAKVRLFVDGKLVDTKTADIEAVSEAKVTFPWLASDGFHCFLVRAETPTGISETRYDDNWLMRVLVVGEGQKRIPICTFGRRRAEVEGTSGEGAGLVCRLS